MKGVMEYFVISSRTIGALSASALELRNGMPADYVASPITSSFSASNVSALRAANVLGGETDALKNTNIIIFRSSAAARTAAATANPDNSARTAVSSY
jgi:hypothetical protein